MLLEEFEKLDIDGKLNILFGLFNEISDLKNKFDNHIKHHESFERGYWWVLGVGLFFGIIITSLLVLLGFKGSPIF
jgi:hypothetical protein